MEKLLEIGIQNYAVTYKPYVDYKENLLIKIPVNTASVKVIKKDAEKLTPIKDTQFSLYNKEGELLQTAKTNKNGEIIFEKLYQGTYVLKETKSNESYIKDDVEYEIKTEYNKQIIKEIKNVHKKGNLKIVKVDKDNNNITLGGIEFDLIDLTGNKVEHLTTNADGEAYINNINIGKYVLKETKTKKEYGICADEDIVVKWNETTQKIIENEKKKGRIKIVKQDKDFSNIKLEGVEFCILDKNNKLIEKITTNMQGEAISSKLPIGEYYIKETKSDNKYVMNTEIFKLEIKENKTSTLKVTNRKKKGKINIIKVSSKESPLFDIKKGDYVSNVKFQIFDEKNNLIETIITDENGQAISKDLEIGRYKIKEIVANENYILNKNEFFVNIERDSEIKIIKIENEPIIPEIKILKKGQEYAEKNEEIKYEFDIENNSNTQIENFTWKEYIPYNQVEVTKMITGSYNDNIEYKIYYKTNKNDYKLFTLANSSKSQYLNFSDIKLDINEKITEIKVEYGTVDKKFRSTTKPTVFVKINEKVNKSDEILNETEISGTIKGSSLKDKSFFKTIIIEKERIKKLPKTGK